MLFPVPAGAFSSGSPCCAEGLFCPAGSFSMAGFSGICPAGLACSAVTCGMSATIIPAVCCLGSVSRNNAAAAATAPTAAATLRITGTGRLPLPAAGFRSASVRAASIFSQRPSGAGSSQPSIFSLMSSSIPFILVIIYHLTNMFLALCRQEADVPGAMPRAAAISLWLICWKT